MHIPPRQPSAPQARTITLGGLVLTPGDPRVVIGNQPVFLTAQELKLLQLLARQPGEIFSSQALARLMARGSKPLTDTGVSVHVHRLRNRLAPAGVRIRTLRGFGYLLETIEAAERDA